MGAGQPRCSAVAKMLTATTEEIGCSIQEKAVFGILDDPLKAFPEVFAGHCAARHDPPFVRVNVVQVQSLVMSLISVIRRGRRLPTRRARRIGKDTPRGFRPLS